MMMHIMDNAHVIPSLAARQCACNSLYKSADCVIADFHLGQGCSTPKRT